MVNYQIELEGEDWKVARWKARSDGFNRDLGALFDTWAEYLLERIVARVPRLSGDLAKSMRKQTLYRRTGEDVDYFIRLWTDTFYADFVEYGTGIYSVAPDAPKQKIYPRNSKALRIPLGGRNFRSLITIPAGVADEMQIATPVSAARLRAEILRRYILGQRPQTMFGTLLEEHTPAILSDVQRLMQQYGFNA